MILGLREHDALASYDLSGRGIAAALRAVHGIHQGLSNEPHNQAAGRFSWPNTHLGKQLLHHFYVVLSLLKIFGPVFPEIWVTSAVERGLVYLYSSKCGFKHLLQ